MPAIVLIYKSKNGKDTKEFEAVDFIASLFSHIPNKNEQMVRYMGYYNYLEPEMKTNFQRH